MTINKAQEIRFEKIVEKLKKKHSPASYKDEIYDLYHILNEEDKVTFIFKLFAFKNIVILFFLGEISSFSGTWSLTKDEINEYLTKIEEELK